MKTPVEKLRDLVQILDETPNKKGVQVKVSKVMDTLLEEILGA